VILNPYSYATTFSPPSNLIALPLTYDEDDYAGIMTWTRQGNGPHVTPGGFEGDGYESRLKSTNIPSWMSGHASALTMHASISFYPQKLGSTSAMIVYCGENDSTPFAKMNFSVIPDVTNSGITQCALLAGTGGTSFVQKNMGRSSWKFQFRCPDTSVGGKFSRMQSIVFLDDETALVSAHFEDTLTRFYKVRLSDAVVLDTFDADGDWVHVGVVAFNAAGDLWALAASGKGCRIDLNASFAAGSIVTLDTLQFSGFAAGSIMGALEFVTVSGTEYAIMAEYLTSGSPFFYAFPSSSLGSVTLTPSDRTKRFTGAPLEIQGLCMRSGKLMTSAIAPMGGTNRFGYINRCDIVTAIGSTSDGGAVSSEAQFDGPTKLAEDIAVHPVTNELWGLSEGISAVGSDVGGSSVWSSPVDGSIVTNHYTAEYDGSGTITIKINNRPYDSLSATLGIDVAVVSIGGPPLATAGFASKFFAGFVSNVVFQDTSMTDAQYNAAISGFYEPNALTVYSLTLTNPGAESTTATGWTNETGTLSVFDTATLLPHSGAYSFYAGNTATFQARQRLDLSAQTGLTGTDIDAAVGWTKVRWWQSAFNSTRDPGCCGVRNVNGSGTQLTLATAGSAPTPNADGTLHPWYPRAYALALESGVRSVDCVLKGTRTAGTNCNVYYDDLSMTVYVR
jgi:hypothetical protein